LHLHFIKKVDILNYTETLQHVLSFFVRRRLLPAAAIRRNPMPGGFRLNQDVDLRKTKQRKKLLDIFTSIRKPLTADQILKQCQNECPNMALTTVYRNLDRLIDLGYVTKAVYPDGTARFASAQNNHKHMVTCRICHAQVAIDNCPVQMSEELISQQTGYLIEHHYLEFFGVCPDCLKRELPFKRRRTHLPGIPQDDASAEDDDVL
jgi:Fe2+ or Zn2+ uptake regulation protein